MAARFGAALAALLAVWALTASAAEAKRTPSSFVVLLSDPEAWVGGGNPRFFHAGNARIGIKGTARFFTVSITSGTPRGEYYNLDFAAPRGKRLWRGVYVGAERAVFRSPGHPGIDISGNHAGCNKIKGLFEVKDIAVDRRGRITRIWLLYEQHCEGNRDALFGEVRLGEPPQQDPALAMPRTVRWPETDVGSGTTVMPAALTAFRSPLRVRAVAVAGANAGDFLVRTDECTGRALARRETCLVWLQFVPRAAGTRRAVLVIVGAEGRRRRVVLQGIAFDGRSGVTMTSDPGDYIGGGRPWSYSFANSREIEGGGNREILGLGVLGNDGISWSFGFAPPPRSALKVGTYLNATRWPFNDNGPGIDIGRGSRGCNAITGQFTVNELRWWPDGSLRAASVTFEQHCEGGPAALRGTFDYRAGDRTPLPFWRVGRIRSGR